MAFGNGAPDIFSSLAGISQARPELVLGELFGAGIFVTSVVAGAVCITTPFKLMERPFLRDIVFYLAAGYWAFCIFYRGQIHLYDSLGFLALYVVYILVVLVGRFVNQKQRNDRLIEDETSSSDDVGDGGDGQERLRVEEEDLSVFVPHPQRVRSPPPRADGEGELDGDDEGRQEVDLTELRRRSSDLANVDTRSSTRKLAWKRLWAKLAPFKWEEFLEMNFAFKAWEIVKAPVILALRVTIPVVDDDDFQRGWCQLLHVVQCYLAPVFVVFAVKAAFVPVFGGVVLWQAATFLGQLMSLFILCTSEPNSPPVYHPILSYLGFGSAVVWIYLVANEIVSLLKTFGIIFGLSDAILGLTILAWGNSIGDLVADVAIAKQGYPRMGYSACFGGPVRN